MVLKSEWQMVSQKDQDEKGKRHMFRDCYLFFCHYYTKFNLDK